MEDRLPSGWSVDVAAGGRGRCRSGKVAPCSRVLSVWRGLSRENFLGACPAFALRRRARRSSAPRSATPFAWPSWSPPRREPARVGAGDAQIDADQAAVAHDVSSVCVGWTCSPAAAMQARNTVQGDTPNRGSHSCAATGPGLQGPAHFPHPGYPWLGPCGNQTNEASPHGTPQTQSRRHPRISRDDHATLGPQHRGESTATTFLT
jgi:hypothetical protein